jgi:hypothetical protein
MAATDDHSRHDVVMSLEENVGRIVEQLSECRKENELLKSELSSLQNILRSCKLPGTEGSSGNGTIAAGDGFSYADKLQVKQKLVLILQKIEMELRSDQIRF